MAALLSSPWPWYVAGPLIGLMVPALLLVGNRFFGISSSFRHACAALWPAGIAYFDYDWKQEVWNLWFVGGIVVGGWLTAHGLGSPAPLLPLQWLGWPGVLSWQGLLMSVGGGLLIGFGTRYAGGCTGGHAIAGLATLQRPSLVATLAFFAGGLCVTWLALPLITGSAS